MGLHLWRSEGLPCPTRQGLPRTPGPGHRLPAASLTHCLPVGVADRLPSPRRGAAGAQWLLVMCSPGRLVQCSTRGFGSSGPQDWMSPGLQRGSGLMEGAREVMGQQGGCWAGEEGTALNQHF